MSDHTLMLRRPIPAAPLAPAGCLRSRPWRSPFISPGYGAHSLHAHPASRIVSQIRAAGCWQPMRSYGLTARKNVRRSAAVQHQAHASFHRSRLNWRRRVVLR